MDLAGLIENREQRVNHKGSGQSVQSPCFFSTRSVGAPMLPADFQFTADVDFDRAVDGFVFRISSRLCSFATARQKCQQ